MATRHAIASGPGSIARAARGWWEARMNGTDLVSRVRDSLTIFRAGHPAWHTLVGLCWETMLGFIRLATHRQVMANPLPPKAPHDRRRLLPIPRAPLAQSAHRVRLRRRGRTRCSLRILESAVTFRDKLVGTLQRLATGSSARWACCDPAIVEKLLTDQTRQGRARPARRGWTLRRDRG
jgi:hypothetical protein